VKGEGELVWRRHDDTDELFFVITGHLTIADAGRRCGARGRRPVGRAEGSRTLSGGIRRVSAPTDRAVGNAKYGRCGRRALRTRRASRRVSADPSPAAGQLRSLRARVSPAQRRPGTDPSLQRRLRGASGRRGLPTRVPPFARFVGCLCSSDFAVARIERQHIEPWTFSAMLRPFDVHSSPCHTGTVAIVRARPHHAEVEPSVEDSSPTRIGCRGRLFRAPPRRRDNADEPISSARPQEGGRPPRRMVS
jgi:hypothetical protein